MKKILLIINFLALISYSHADEKEYELICGNARLCVAKDGKSLSLQTGAVQYLSWVKDWFTTETTN